MSQNPYQPPDVLRQPSDHLANKPLPSLLWFAIGTVAVLAASMSLDLVIMYGGEFTGLVLWKRALKSVGPFSPLFAVGFTLSLARPRHWIAAGCGPMLACLVILCSINSREVQQSSTGPVVFFAFSVALTVWSLAGAALGMWTRGWLNSQYSRKAGSS